MDLNAVLTIVAAIIGGGGISAFITKWMTRKATQESASAKAKQDEAEAAASAIDSTSKMWELIKKSNEDYAKHIEGVKDFYKEQNLKLQAKIEAGDKKHEDVLISFKKVQKEYLEIKSNYTTIRQELDNQQKIIKELLNNYCDNEKCNLRNPPQGSVNLLQIKAKVNKKGMKHENK